MIEEDKNKNAELKKDDITKSEHKEKKTSLIVGIVFYILLGLGGVGFGIYGIIETNNKNAEISNLKSQLEDDSKNQSSETFESDAQDDGIDTDEATADKDDDGMLNPIMPAPFVTSVENIIWYPEFGKPEYYSVAINIKEGAIISCSIYFGTASNMTLQKYCGNVNGLSGKIYKATKLIRGQVYDARTAIVAFVLDNGAVEYITWEDMIKAFLADQNANVQGRLKIDGFVVDVQHAAAMNDGGIGGYGTAVFQLADGKYLEYNPTMLE